MLLDLSFLLSPGNNTCFYGKCYYCRESEPACAEGEIMEGSLTLWLPDVWPLQKHRHPWGRTYREGKLARWVLTLSPKRNFKLVSWVWIVKKKHKKTPMTWLTYYSWSISGDEEMSLTGVYLLVWPPTWSLWEHLPEVGMCPNRELMSSHDCSHTQYFYWYKQKHC